MLYVLLERDGLVVEGRAIETAYEARVLQYQLLLLLLGTQIGEGVDYHTENQVENYDDNYEEEQQVVHHSRYE